MIPILNNLNPVLVALGLTRNQADGFVTDLAALAEITKGRLESLEAQANTAEAERAAAVAECERLKARIEKLKPPSLMVRYLEVCPTHITSEIVPIDPSDKRPARYYIDAPAGTRIIVEVPRE